MRFIHTADWHLGQLFHGVHLTENQAHILERFPRRYRGSTQSFPWRTSASHAQAPYIQVKTALEQFVAFVKDGKPDVVLIAGDIYDRAVPPPEAVGLQDDVLSRPVLGLKVPVESMVT